MAKYLGVFLGPGHVAESWDHALAKFWDRARTIAACGLSPQLAIIAYNTYALTVLGYLCQFFWVPFEALRLEQRALAMIFRIPMHALELQGSFKGP